MLIAFQTKHYFASNSYANIRVSHSLQSENYHYFSDSEFSSHIFTSDQTLVGDSYFRTTSQNNENVHNEYTNVSAALSKKFGDSHEIETGCFWEVGDLNYDARELDIIYYPDAANSDSTIRANNAALTALMLKAGLYFQDNWQITDRLYFNAGIRTDYYNLNQEITYSPRFSATFQFDQKNSVSIATGTYYQTPEYNELLYSYSTDKNTQSQKATHYITSWQSGFGKYINLSASIYYKKYDGIIPFYWSIGKKLSEKKNLATGDAKGFEAQLNFTYSGITGWLNYSYLEAREKLNTESDYYPKSTDQRHTFNIFTKWDISNTWRLYIKYLYGSGYPHTPSIFDPVQQDFSEGAKNSLYLPAYERLDIRLSKSFHYSWAKLNIFMEVINVFNHKNIVDYSRYWMTTDGETFKKPVYLFPCLPNVGVNIKF